jgi:hypothetical protein
MAQVQQAGRDLALAEQAAEPPPQSRGFGKVGVALFRPQHEDGGRIGRLLNESIELA